MGKGELVPGQDRTSLLGGVMYQLAGREGSGSVFEDGTLGNATVSIWLQLDTLFPVVALVATGLAFAVRRLRPFAVAMVVLLAMLVRPGYLPVPFVIALLPLGALLVAGVAAALWEHRPTRLGRRAAQRPTGLALALAGGLLVGAAVPGYASQLRGLTTASLDAPMTEATRWIDANVPTDERILTDDAIWVDLVEQGRDRGNVVWFYKPDTDPAVPTGAAAYQWVVSTDSVRSDPQSFPTLDEALGRAVPVAAFGEGDRRVEILRGEPGDLDATVLADRRAASAAAGQQLVANPALDVTPLARDQLLSGRVDPRLLTVLAGLGSRYDLAVESLPQPAAEEAAEAPRRTVRITTVDGEPVSRDAEGVAAVTSSVASQNAAYRADATVVDATDGAPAALVLSFPLD